MYEKLDKMAPRRLEGETTSQSPIDQDPNQPFLLLGLETVMVASNHRYDSKEEYS